MNKFLLGDIVVDPAEKCFYKVVGVDHKKQIYSFAIDDDLEFASHFDSAHEKYVLTSLDVIN